MITFIIPARGGSKRLRNKNIKLLNGKPLVFYTIEALLNHKLIHQIIFTSDSQEYCDIVQEKFKNKVLIIERPEITAGDKVKVVDEIERLLIEEKKLFKNNWFGLALPTAPLRNWNTVDKLLKIWNENNDSYFSSSKYDFPIQFAFDINKNGEWIPLLENSPMITGKTRSQDIKSYYRPNGAIYIKNIQHFFNKKILYDKAKPYLISNIESFDIDTEIDFTFVENYLKNIK